MSAPATRVRLVEDGRVTVPAFRWPTTAQVRKGLDKAFERGDRRGARVCAAIIDVRERAR
jgi:hypothetical protein